MWSNATDAETAFMLLFVLSETLSELLFSVIILTKSIGSYAGIKIYRETASKILTNSKRWTEAWKICVSYLQLIRQYLEIPIKWHANIFWIKYIFKKKEESYA